VEGLDWNTFGGTILTFSTINDSGPFPFATLPTDPNALAVTADGNMLFADFSSFPDGLVMAYTTTTGQQATATPVVVCTSAIAGCNVGGMAVAKNKLYIAATSLNRVVVIDIAASSPTKFSILTDIPVGSGPYDIVSSYDGNYIYVTNSSSDNISIINTTSDTRGWENPCWKASTRHSCIFRRFSLYW
jgi:DNA-binding beta-propeller fold protein YncE